MQEAFQPRSRIQNETRITRDQRSFGAGLFKDIPASTIPDSGVAELENFVNYGNRLEGRGGSKKWTDTELPTMYTGYNCTSTVSGNTRTITAFSGTAFSQEFIGRFFIWDNGVHERITSFISATQVTTYTFSTEEYMCATGKVRGDIHAIYPHNFTGKIVMLIGREIYVANDTSISSWNKAYCSSLVDVNESISEIEELDTYAIIYNANGIFRLDLSSDVYTYYKTNSHIPETKITNSGTEGTGTPYGRRYIFSMSRITGESQDRNRQTTGVYIEQESGTNAIDTNLLDYAEYWTANPVSATNGVTVGFLTTPMGNSATSERERHWTHYSVYCTKDTGTNGTDPVNGIGNNDQLFTWLEDVPCIKVLTTTRATNTITAVNGTFARHDIGSTLRVYNGSAYEDLVISAYTDSTHVTVSTAGSDYTARASVIGATSTVKGYQSGATFTKTEGPSFTSNDVGKTLYFDNGFSSLIIGFTSATVITLQKEQTYGVVGTPISVGFNIYRRSYYDTTEEYQLTNRIGWYPTHHRFWEPIPECNTGNICSGFMFTAYRGGSYINYTQLPTGFEYLLGYYNAAYQFAVFKDSITSLYEFPDKLIVFCNNSTHAIPLNTFDSKVNEALSTTTILVAGQTVLDNNIGCVSQGSIQQIELGRCILVTSEPAVRIFNGISYSENLSENKINNDIKQMQQPMCSSYDPINGYVLWGFK